MEGKEEELVEEGEPEVGGAAQEGDGKAESVEDKVCESVLKKNR